MATISKAPKGESASRSPTDTRSGSDREPFQTPEVTFRSGDEPRQQATRTVSKSDQYRRTMSSGVGFAPESSNGFDSPPPEWRASRASRNRDQSRDEPIPETRGDEARNVPEFTNVEEVGAGSVELVDPETGDPRLFLFAPNGVKVQFNRATESPPPVQVSYAPPAPTGIPLRIALPLGIIVFAAGAMLVLLVLGKHGHGNRVHASELGGPPTEPQPLAQAIEPVTPALQAAPPAVSASPLPLIVLDIPANDSAAMSVSKSARGNDDKAAERRRNRSKLRFDAPD
jgi:hypothetical protein